MSTLHIGCPLCGARERRTSRLYRAHHLVQCGACGFRYSEQEPSVEELRDLYANYGMVRDLSPITALRYDALLKELEAYRNTGLLLEVGSGGGLLLDHARAAGWHCHGTEYDPKVVAECRARGFEMHDGALLDHPWQPGSFDAVISIEVVEHLPRPMADLREMVRLLRPGGALYITTPNFNSISKWLAYGKWSIVNYPEHISFFTPRTMHNALVSLGMQRKWMRTTGFSITRFRLARGGSYVSANGISNDEQLRRTIEQRPLLKMAKRSVDSILDFTGKGDSLKLVYVKTAQ